MREVKCYVRYSILTFCYRKSDKSTKYFKKVFPLFSRNYRLKYNNVDQKKINNRNVSRLILNSKCHMISIKNLTY